MERGARPAGDRLEVVDAMRGFALFGILLANILYWSGWGLMTDPQRLDLGGVDGLLWQYRFHHLLVDGKFYTLFSLLFGAGFALQLSRLLQAGHDGLRIYRRRVLVLLGIGLVHSWLIWDGDILTLYALLGLLLPLFHRWRDGALLWTAALLIFVVPFAGIALFAALGWAPGQWLMGLSMDWAQRLGANVAPDQVIAWLAREDWQGLWAWLASGTPYSWGIRLESWRIPKVLGIMLVGLVAGRRLAAGTLLTDRRLLLRVLIGGLLVGVPASLAYALQPGQEQDSWPSLIGTVPLALAYAAGFVLAWPHAQRLLGIFTAPGRMALTNYLTHSLLGIFVFYGVGFGMIGRMPPFAFYAYAVGLFGLQIVFSRWWLSRHAQGPMEALWRRWTYGARAFSAV
ncbi:MAG: DUF418 domain-containing protein [Thermomonas sp.]